MSDFSTLLGREDFAGRHIGPDEGAQREMLQALGVPSREALIGEVVPKAIRLSSPLALGEAVTELQATNDLSAHAARNEIWRSFIGMGYYGTYTPAVIQRNVMENPGWYTAYTPYQAEISQGRLEALLNFQQMVIDLTGLPVANASLLDEATAAAEAMTMIRRSAKSKATAFFVDAAVHPQVLAVMRTRAKWLGIDLVSGELDPAKVFGAHLQYPNTFGQVVDHSSVIAKLHAADALVSLGTDLLALVLLRSPGALGADIAIGSAQRFGVPMGFGGPHAAFMACRDDYKRSMPGRIIGVSHDAAGRPAFRMALQTREQHIRRDKATSNICTAQALLANMAGFYAVYHGPAGLRRIALRTNFMARLLAACVKAEPTAYFDTVLLKVPSADIVRAHAEMKRVNLRYLDATRLAVSFDETTTLDDVANVVEAIAGQRPDIERVAKGLTTEPVSIPDALRRSDPVLTHTVFNRYHTETEMMRYLKRLENRDLSLVHSMIPLGSCTMKLNAAVELIPLSWPKFAGLHPFVPIEQARGTLSMLRELEAMLAEITGFARVSLQPNSGAQGEYAGLLAIRDYFASKNQSRDVCLIPASAHGTNPASASMMGLRVMVVGCDKAGNVDIADLEKKLAEHGPRVAVLMITYPSTHGVFEEGIVRICELVHAAGAQVYMDGANMNALTGLAKPGLIGADVCHINLHKTFCIPHGGGGPGMGPIAVAAHLAPHLPAHPLQDGESVSAAPAVVSAAPFGSALILLISWMYIRMMGAAGLRKATEVAILNANYVATRIAPYFPVLYQGANGRVAHECILDLRKLKDTCGVTAEDIAKRLMDYGFHSPTLSFPVADTLMVEPTESESKEELDRFCHAMISIHAELQKVTDRANNLLKNAPHTALELAGEWKHPYSREEAAFPAPWLRAAKYWPPVKRIDNAAGDRQFICTCPPIEAYA